MKQLTVNIANTFVNTIIAYGITYVNTSTKFDIILAVPPPMVQNICKSSNLISDIPVIDDRDHNNVAIKTMLIVILNDRFVFNWKALNGLQITKYLSIEIIVKE